MARIEIIKGIFAHVWHLDGMIRRLELPSRIPICGFSMWLGFFAAQKPQDNWIFLHGTSGFKVKCSSEQGGSCIAFSDLTLEVIQCHF